MRRTILIGACIATLLTACGGDGGAAGGSPTPTAPVGQRPASTAELTIVEPRPGASLEGPDIDVVVQVEGATILERASRNLTPDTGHIHVIVDGEVIDRNVFEDRYTVKDLEPGDHIIKVEFAAADHGSFSPPVIETVRITVT